MSVRLDYEVAVVMCRIFHNVFYKQPSRNFLSEFSDGQLLKSWPVFTSDVAGPIKKITDSLKEKDHNKIKRDYIKLFIGPGEKLAYPWGSVYTDKEGCLFGETTFRLKSFCNENNIKIGLEINEPLDHIGLVFLIFSELLEQCKTKNSNQKCEFFLEEHLFPWCDQFFDSVDKNSVTGFYQGFSSLARIFVRDFHDLLKIRI